MNSKKYLNPVLIDFQVLESYLVEQNADDILLEFKQNAKLTDIKRCKLTNHVANFLMSTYGEYPSTQVKGMVANAVINLFPSERYKESKGDGTVRQDDSNIFLTFLTFTNFLW